MPKSYKWDGMTWVWISEHTSAESSANKRKTDLDIFCIDIENWFNKFNITCEVNVCRLCSTQITDMSVYHIPETGLCFSTSGGSTGGSRDSPRVSASLHNLDLRVFGA